MQLHLQKQEEQQQQQEQQEQQEQKEHKEQGVKVKQKKELLQGKAEMNVPAAE
jgi:hypothetical protein